MDQLASSLPPDLLELPPDHTPEYTAPGGSTTASSERATPVGESTTPAEENTTPAEENTTPAGERFDKVNVFSMKKKQHFHELLET